MTQGRSSAFKLRAGIGAFVVLVLGVPLLTSFARDTTVTDAEPVSTVVTTTRPAVDQGAAEAAVGKFEQDQAAYFASVAYLNHLSEQEKQAAARKAAKTKPQAPKSSPAPVVGSGDGEMERFLACVKQRESGGNYTARNPSSTAAGAYQFLDSTARLVAGWMGRPDLSSDAATWSPADQEAGARILYKRMGKSPWHYPPKPC